MTAARTAGTLPGARLPRWVKAGFWAVVGVEWTLTLALAALFAYCLVEAVSMLTWRHGLARAPVPR